ncbi:hypothetical protein [Teredinibacter franksiae]|uniref:hypothetical protein n=1 Tax=Teredinibacter franksiae TaxID=2761453 RepID=UPI001628E608|nr:hypothetical protein [Teredinibacter franksiae]
MIDKERNPIEWAQLMYELDDVHEHLGDLITKMNTSNEVRKEEYSIEMAHIYAHINRAWNSRNTVGEISESERKVHTEFPKDLKPIG